MKGAFYMERTKRKSIAFFLFFPCFFLITAAMILTGCSNRNTPSDDASFTAFLDDCFQEYVSSDTVTLHFKLSDPSAYGITEHLTPSYGDFSVDKQQELCQRSSVLLEELHTFDPDALSAENAFTWKIFQNALESSIASEDYILYSSPFGANGLQSQIPVTLSEYYFDDEKDIQDYLALVNQIPELFDQILAFEKQRRDAGIISPDFVISNTIDQIDRFLSASEDNNLLIDTFETRLETVADLSHDQKQTYSNNNRSLIRQVVLPAFASLKNSLEQYLDSDTEKERLCQYENGRNYYSLLLSAKVGTSMTPEECIQALETQLQETATDIASLTRENPDLYTDYLTAQPSLTDAQQILTELENDTCIDFPQPPEVSYILKSVPDALSSTSASAFYLLPPVDAKNANCIYINENRVDEQDLFSTLAHEGYPGHLYQTNYFLNINPVPLRFMLRWDGYDEGWGTYAQLYSYEYMEFEETDSDTTKLLQQLYRDNDILSLSLSSLSDLYVNYENYTQEDLSAYLSDYGIPEENAQTIYEYVIENPTTYLSYSIGWYELEQLKNNMKEQFGNDFDIRNFHEAVLSCGSCPFLLLEEKVSSLMTLMTE